jgi:hypothetical protein
MAEPTAPPAMRGAKMNSRAHGKTDLHGLQHRELPAVRR